MVENLIGRSLKALKNYNPIRKEGVSARTPEEQTSNLADIFLGGALRETVREFGDAPITDDAVFLALKRARYNISINSKHQEKLLSPVDAILGNLENEIAEKRAKR